MSLINQMLRDLQQKKEGSPAKPKPARPSMMEKIPYLPLPLVLAGGALVLICFIWWLAGALSDLMFGFEPASKPAVVQQVASGESAAITEVNIVDAEPDQLTQAERDAEPPVAVIASEPIVEQTPPVKAPSVPVVKMATRKPVPAQPVAGASSRASSKKRVTAPVRLTKAPKPVPTPRKVFAKAAPKRLHPDDLPGAILSSSHSLPATKKIARPSSSSVTTPYGMAEEAYLDGKWALEHKRGGLAVDSLQKSLELYPGHLPARELLVEVLSKEGKSGEAMFLLAEGLEIAPDYIAFKKDYARLLAGQGDYEAATKVMLNGGLPTVEADPEAHVVLASLYQRLGEPFLAAQTYRNLLIAWPQTGAFWVGLGSSLEAQNLPEEAVECYEKALRTKNLRQDLSLYAQKRLNLLD